MLVRVCLCMCVWKCVYKVININKYKQNCNDVTCSIKIETVTERDVVYVWYAHTTSNFSIKNGWAGALSVEITRQVLDSSNIGHSHCRLRMIQQEQAFKRVEQSQPHRLVLPGGRESAMTGTYTYRRHASILRRKVSHTHTQADTHTQCRTCIRTHKVSQTQTHKHTNTQEGTQIQTHAHCDTHVNLEPDTRNPKP